MPTWHQEREGKKLPALYHPTKWTSYNPTGPLSVMRHESAEECLAYCDKTGDVPLPPQGGQAKPNN